MTVGELLERVSSKELTEWKAFEMLDGPIGEWRDDFRTGQIASTIANRSLGEGETGYRATDFIPNWDAPEDLEEEEDPRKKAREQMTVMQRLGEAIKGRGSRG